MRVARLARARARARVLELEPSSVRWRELLLDTLEYSYAMQLRYTQVGGRSRNTRSLDDEQAREFLWCAQTARPCDARSASVLYVRSPSPCSTCRARVFTRGIRVRVLACVDAREEIVERRALNSRARGLALDTRV